MALILSMTAPVPPGALVVHRRDLLLAAGLGVFLEDDDLGVLAAQLDRPSRTLGVELLDRQRDRVDLLHELRADARARCPPPPRAGDEHAESRRAGIGKSVSMRRQELEALLGLLGLVALVVLPQDLVGRRVDDHRLDRGRADVEPDVEALVVVPSCWAARRPGRASPIRRPPAAISSATCSTKFAAVPIDALVVGHLVERPPAARGCCSAYSRTSSSVTPVSLQHALDLRAWPSPWPRRAPSARGCAR